MFSIISKNKMEESIKISLLGQEKAISKDSIFNLSPLLTEENFKLVRRPPWMDFFKPNMGVLHSCIYYTLTVEKELQLSRSLDFREKCLVSISDYYISQKMNFQLYEYAYLTSKILALPLDKTMHLIYFLVYARLASKPFITSIILEMDKKNRQLKKKITMKSEKDYSIQSKSHDSRHLTVFCDINSTETENLKRELKKIMNPQAAESKKMTKKMENRRYFNVRKLYPCEAELKEESERQPAEYRSTATSRVATIPTKVSNRENSSVISRLKFKSGIGSEDNLFKKVNVRRQKFNENFESTEKYLKMLNQRDCKENKKPECVESKMAEKEKGSANAYYRTQKNAFEYFQGIASSIRSKNDQFDWIRYSCVNHKDRNFFSCKESLANYDRDSILSKHTIKTESATIELPTADTNRQPPKDTRKQEYLNATSQKLGEAGKMSKTASMGKVSQLMQDYLLGSITRKNESTGAEDEQIVLFNRKLNNKFKLQKYKQEYHQFLKTQLFQRSKDI